VPLLLLLDGTDWASTLANSAAYCGTGAFDAAALASGLYVLRHGAVGPAMSCLPRHRMPSYSGNEGS